MNHETLFRLTDEYHEIACHPAEIFCLRVLSPVPTGMWGHRDPDAVFFAFRKFLDLLPLTPDECRREIQFWADLGTLRDPAAPGDGISYEAEQRLTFVKDLLELFESDDTLD